MRHTSLKKLRALEAGGLEGRQRRRVADHLAGCPACRERVLWVRDIRAGAAEVTAPTARDHEGVWRSVEARLDAAERLILPVPPTGPRSGDVPTPARPGRRLRPAAAAAVGLLVLAGAGAAATGVSAGSWLREVVEGLRGFTGQGPEDLPPEAAPVAGIDVPVPPGGLTVSLENAAPDLRLAVEVVAVTPGTGGAPLASLEGVGQAAGARFRVGVDRVVVAGAVGGELRLRVPAGAPRVRVVADGVTLLEVREGGVLPRGATATPSLEATVGDLRALADAAGMEGER